MNCIKCNEEIDNNSKFCSFCGMKVKDVNVELPRSIKEVKNVDETLELSNKKSNDIKPLHFYILLLIIYIFSFITNTDGIPDIPTKLLAGLSGVFVLVGIPTIIYFVSIGFKLSEKRKPLNVIFYSSLIFFIFFIFATINNNTNMKNVEYLNNSSKEVIK